MVLASLGDAALNLAGVRQRRSDSGSGGGGDIIFRIGKEETSIYELRTKGCVIPITNREIQATSMRKCCFSRRARGVTTRMRNENGKCEADKSANISLGSIRA